MERRQIGIVIGIFLILAIAFVVRKEITGRITGNIISENVSLDYSYTKAYCDENKECVDFHIKCSNGIVVSIKPISPIVYHGDSWKDPRGSEGEFNLTNLC